MEIGIFAKTFARPNVEAVFEAVKDHGLNCVQFNFACAGLPSMPEQIDPAIVKRIASAAEKKRVTISAVSGTFNMAHPNAAVRDDGLRRLRALASICSDLGTAIITLCTGTRDPEDMWRYHPDNSEPEAWNDLVISMSEALRIADEHAVTLGIEPEVNNVVDSARKARRLLDDMQSMRLKIVMDPANLFHPGELTHMREAFDAAFGLLGNDIVIAHAKDLVENRNGIQHVAAGQGRLDYAYYMQLLREMRFRGPVILHGLSESEVAGSVAFLRGKLDRN